MSAKELYQRFHGHAVRWAKNFPFRQPSGPLVILGRAIAIEYECDKLNGGGDGTKAIYRHEFETPAVVCMDETGRKQLYILGNKIIVTRDGIEN